MKFSGNEDCEECNGEGYVEYARGEDTECLPCQVCFPPDNKFGTTSWEDLADEDEGSDR